MDALCTMADGDYREGWMMPPMRDRDGFEGERPRKRHYMTGQPRYDGGGFESLCTHWTSTDPKLTPHGGPRAKRCAECQRRLTSRTVAPRQVGR